MSDDSHDGEMIDLMIMEEEVKIANADAAKKSIVLRIAKRKSEIRRDTEHLELQDKEVEKARSQIEQLKQRRPGG